MSRAGPRLSVPQPFYRYTEDHNPAWLAVEPLTNSIIEDEQNNVRPIHVSTLQIPVSYQSVMDVVPLLHQHPSVHLLHHLHEKVPLLSRLRLLHLLLPLLLLSSSERLLHLRHLPLHLPLPPRKIPKRNGFAKERRKSRGNVLHVRKG